MGEGSQEVYFSTHPFSYLPGGEGVGRGAHAMGEGSHYAYFSTHPFSYLPPPPFEKQGCRSL
jgi:hypothetical protein